MKIKITGAVFTALFLVVVVYLLYNVFADSAVTVTEPTHLIDLATGIGGLISGISNMLWGQRGIDMVIQAAFIFVAALAASVFFHEVRKE